MAARGRLREELSYHTFLPHWTCLWEHSELQLLRYLPPTTPFLHLHQLSGNGLTTRAFTQARRLGVILGSSTPLTPTSHPPRSCTLFSCPIGPKLVQQLYSNRNFLASSIYLPLICLLCYHRREFSTVQIMSRHVILKLKPCVASQSSTLCHVSAHTAPLPGMLLPLLVT